MSQNLRDEIRLDKKFSKDLELLCKCLKENIVVVDGDISGFYFKSEIAKKRANRILDKLISKYIEEYIEVSDDKSRDLRGFLIDPSERSKIFSIGDKCTTEFLFENIANAAESAILKYDAEYMLGNIQSHFSANHHVRFLDAGSTRAEKLTTTPSIATTALPIATAALQAVSAVSSVLSNAVSPSSIATVTSRALDLVSYDKSYRGDRCAVPNFWEASGEDMPTASGSRALEIGMVAGGTILAAYTIHKLIGMGRNLLGRAVGGISVVRGEDVVPGASTRAPTAPVVEGAEGSDRTARQRRRGREGDGDGDSDSTGAGRLVAASGTGHGGGDGDGDGLSGGLYNILRPSPQVSSSRITVELDSNIWILGKNRFENRFDMSSFTEEERAEITKNYNNVPKNTLDNLAPIEIRERFKTIVREVTGKEVVEVRDGMEI